MRGALTPSVPPSPPFASDRQKLDILLARLARNFCRRCKVYECSMHRGGNPK